MKASELRDKSIDDLESTIVSLSKEQFGYRMQQSTGQLRQTHLLKTCRRDIARVKTVLNEKNKGE